MLPDFIIICSLILCSSLQGVPERSTWFVSVRMLCFLTPNGMKPKILVIHFQLLSVISYFQNFIDIFLIFDVYFLYMRNTSTLRQLVISNFSKEVTETVLDISDRRLFEPADSGSKVLILCFSFLFKDNKAYNVH